jgi:hypothetical protein
MHLIFVLEIGRPIPQAFYEFFLCGASSKSTYISANPD